MRELDSSAIPSAILYNRFLAKIQRDNPIQAETIPVPNARILTQGGALLGFA